MQDYQIALLGGAAIILMIVWQAIRTRQKQKKNLQERIKKLWGELPDREYKDEDIENISHYYQHRKGTEFSIDDITWNDLDMDRVFAQLNHTWTSAGEEYLYYTLRVPSFSEEELCRRDALADYFGGHAKEREELQKLLAYIGRTKRLSISDYMDQVTGLSTESTIMHYMCIFLLVASVVSLFIVPQFGVLFLVAVVCFNILTYYKTKAKVEPYFICLEYLGRMAKYGERISALPREGVLKEHYDRLGKLTKKLVKIRKGVGMLGTSGSMGGNPMQVIWDYMLILLHLDLIRFNHLLNVVQENRPAVYGLLEEIGKLELGLLTGSYRKMMPLVSVPELKRQKGHGIVAEDLYHPLLGEPVANSISTQKPVLLTGSNASGKSTFLKTVAINGILAQSIHTVLASRYVGEYGRIYSSMALRDDIIQGESYYIVEIKSLKRILEAARDQDSTVICFVDEVLRGTNTVERIAASSQILKWLSEQGVLCFAATHDIELTELLKDHYANYHFEEEVRDGDVCFNYQLQKGKATTRNAIRLLSIMGYGGDVIEAAENSAARFVKEGVWKL